MFRRPFAWALVPAAAALAAQAFAQDKPKEEKAEDNVQQVIITTTKRQTLVQDTAQAVTALPQRDLDRAQVKDLASMQKMVPNLTVEQHGDSGGVHVFLRGVGSTNHTELGDPAVAFHVDGVYSPRPQGATVLMFDLGHVEIARGPQGTLFGRNATAGSVNMVTAKPKLGDKSGSAGFVFGDRNRMGVQTAMNLPLADNMALRLAAMTDRQDGWVEFQPRSNVQPGADKYGATNQTALRGTLLWNLSSDITTTTAFEYYRDKGAGNISLAQTPRAGQKWNSALVDTPGVLDQDSQQLRTRVDWALTPGIELSYIGAISTMSRKNASDNDAGLNPGFKQEHRTEWSRFNSNSHELNIKSTDSGPFQWIGGLYTVAEDNRIRFDIDISSTPLAAGNRPIVVVPTLPTDEAWAMSFIQPKRTLSSSAVFGQGTLAFSREVSATVGARYSSEEKKDIGGRNWVCPQFGATLASGGRLIGPGGPVDRASCDSDYDNVVTPGFGANDFGTWPGGGHNDGRTKDNASTYLVRGEYKPSKDMLTYANVSTGFKSGGLSDGGRRHKPEFITNFEIGAKTELFDRALALNLAAFVMKYKDMQVSSIEYTGTGAARQQQLVTSNAARSSISGLEAEWSWRITPATRFVGNLSFLSAKYDDFLTCDSALLNCSLASSVTNLSGETLPHAPKFSLNYALEHEFRMAGGGRLSPRAQVHYETETKLSTFGALDSRYPPLAQTKPDARFQKAYATLDLSLRYDDPTNRWALEAFMVNVTDKHVKTDVSWNQNTWSSFYNSPRTAGVKAAYKF